MQHIEREGTDRTLFTAGQRVACGRYHELNSGRIITLETDDTLPASLDGRVACYVRLPATWAELATSDPCRATGGQD
jgi:hypothetical protein